MSAAPFIRLQCGAGHDVPFVNNYGVWEDEFRELGLSHCLNATWPDALCYFGEGKQVGQRPRFSPSAFILYRRRQAALSNGAGIKQSL